VARGAQASGPPENAKKIYQVCRERKCGVMMNNVRKYSKNELNRRKNGMQVRENNK
jgi:hypothetical protein